MTTRQPTTSLIERLASDVTGRPTLIVDAIGDEAIETIRRPDGGRVVKPRRPA